MVEISNVITATMSQFVKVAKKVHLVNPEVQSSTAYRCRGNQDNVCMYNSKPELTNRRALANRKKLTSWNQTCHFENFVSRYSGYQTLCQNFVLDENRQIHMSWVQVPHSLE